MISVETLHSFSAVIKIFIQVLNNFGKAFNGLKNFVIFILINVWKFYMRLNIFICKMTQYHVCPETELV